MKPTYRYFTRTAKGTKEVLPPPKTKMFRKPSEGRAMHIIKKPKVVKSKPQIWKTGLLILWFQNHEIHADRTDWFITFNSPSRKMTAADQLEIMLEPPYYHHDVWISEERKHLIIDTLQGYEE